ncbi:MAG: adenylosuccinate lyase [Pseudomonadota bacterium]
MIGRYSRPEMAAVWSDSAKFDTWLQVELAVCGELAARGVVPQEAAATIKRKAAYDIGRIEAIEAEVAHDVIAFLTSVAEKVGPDSRYIHMGMTSSDLVDTAFALQLKKAAGMIAKDISKLLDVIQKRALEHKRTPMIGRSHGIHAEPITLGLKFAVWHSEFSRHAKRLEDAAAGVAVGKMSGAVGTYAHIDPSVERDVCRALGLEADLASTQIVQRDRHAHFFAVLAGIAASVEKVAVEIRHLQRTEVGEAAEAFGKGQKGSSAMPHKRNPILSENLSGLSRVVRANAMAAFEDVALWHERDISHSSVERIIAPDSTILVDFMLARMARVLDGLEIFPERMRANLEMTRGLYNSQEVMLALARAGATREDAYRIVQDAATRSWREGKSFYDLLAEEKDVVSRVPAAELKKIFDVELHLKHVDEIFKRVFK